MVKILSFCLASCLFYTACDCPTRYSAHYSEEAFKQIKIGMDTNEVKAILFEPLSKSIRAFPPRPNSSSRFAWRYSDDTAVRDFPPECCFEMRIIGFDIDYKVTDITSRTELD